MKRITKMAPMELNEHIRKVVKEGRLDEAIQGYDKDDIVYLLRKMEQHLEKFGDKEYMYPEDWKLFIVEIKNRIKSMEQ